MTDSKNAGVSAERPTPEPAGPPRKLDASTWLNAYGDSLYRYAYARLRDEDAAEEVVQETFVAGLKAQDQYAGAGSEGGWLMGICKRKVIDYVRRRNRPDAAQGADDGYDPSTVLFDDKGNWRSDPRFLKGRPEAALERDDFWRALRTCLKGLPQRQADVFTLRDVEATDSNEICKQLNITSSNLWVLLHRARLGLMKCLQGRFSKGGAI